MDKVEFVEGTMFQVTQIDLLKSLPPLSKRQQLPGLCPSTTATAVRTTLGRPTTSHLVEERMEGVRIRSISNWPMTRSFLRSWSRGVMWSRGTRSFRGVR